MEKTIPGSVYLVIGFIVAVMSYMIDKNSLLLFFIVGVVFMGIGAAKIGLKKAEKTARSPIPEVKAPPPAQPQQRRSFRMLNRCARCGATVQPQFNFCPSCGTRHN